MKYPVSFLPNQTRSVYIEGEAFFNVKKATNSIFEVRSNQIIASGLIITAANIYFEDRKSTV